MPTLQFKQKRPSEIPDQERVLHAKELTRHFLMNTKKKFTYEYDLATEGIIRLLLGKQYTTPRDMQRLIDALIQKSYTDSTKRRVQ